MRFVIALFFIIVYSSNLTAQDDWQWQDPNDFGFIDFGDKYLSLTNAAALILTEVFSKKDTSIIEQDRFHFFVYGEYHHEYDQKISPFDVYMLKGRLGYQFRNWLSVGGEVQLFYMHSKEVQTPAIGITTFYSWYIINSKNWKLLYDNGTGVLFSSKQFPKEGTKINFNTFYGLSTQIKIKEKKYLIMGVKNMHISNASLFGDNNNPGFDSIGFLLGIHF